MRVFQRFSVGSFAPKKHKNIGLSMFFFEVNMFFSIGSKRPNINKH